MFVFISTSYTKQLDYKYYTKQIIVYNVVFY